MIVAAFIIGYILIGIFVIGYTKVLMDDNCWSDDVGVVPVCVLTAMFWPAIVPAYVCWPIIKFIYGLGGSIGKTQLKAKQKRIEKLKKIRAELEEADKEIEQALSEIYGEKSNNEDAKAITRSA